MATIFGNLQADFDWNELEDSHVFWGFFRHAAVDIVWGRTLA